jgi:hypothetical protein
MICKSTEQQDAGLCYQFCKAGYTGVGPVCWGGCPANWTQCGAACGVNASACADKIINMVEATAEMVADIAGFVTGAGAAAKIAEEVKEVAEAVKDTASIAAKVNDLVSKIMAKNQTISNDDAQTAAQNEIGQLMAYQQSQGQNPDLTLNTTWDLLAKVDPTGILGAAKAFYYPLCSKV